MGCLDNLQDISPDVTILPPLLRLVGCIESTFEERGLKDLCFLGVVAGTVVDSTYIGEDGGMMAWVRAGEATVQPTEMPQKCGVPLSIEVEVGFLTCYPVNEDGEPMTLEQNLQVVSIVQAAMVALRRAILCCSWKRNSDTGKEVDVDLTRWAPAGPIGGVVGGAWYLTMDV